MTVCRRGLMIDKSFTFGVLAAVASGLMVTFLTYTGYAASKLTPNSLSPGITEADPQNEGKHGQQVARHVEQDVINVLDPDKSSPFPKDRLFQPIRRSPLVKLKLPELDLPRMRMKGRVCWLGMILLQLEVGLGLPIRVWALRPQFLWIWWKG